MLNLHATFTKGTIEFRLFQFDNPTAERKGGLHAGQLKSYIQLCLALSQMAKQVKTASPKEATADGERSIRIPVLDAETGLHRRRIQNCERILP